MGNPFIKAILTIAIALVWLINGLFCKLLDFVPRHQMIVSRILGAAYANIATKTIGILEIGMFIWVLSGIKSRWCALVQMLVVAVMNIIEYFLVPDLLLFGRINAIVAAAFIAIIFVNEFIAGNTNLKTHSSL